MHNCNYCLLFVSISAAVFQCKSTLCLAAITSSLSLRKPSFKVTVQLCHTCASGNADSADMYNMEGFFCVHDLLPLDPCLDIFRL